MSDAQLERVEQALLEGAAANGFTGELWTLDRITTVIQRLTGVRHHPAHVWALPHRRLGWSVQRPVRRPAEHPAALAGGGAPAGLCARPQSGRRAVVQPQAVELANLTGPTLGEVIQQAQRVRQTPHLVCSFFVEPAYRRRDTRRQELHVRQPPVAGYHGRMGPAATRSGR